MNSFGGFHHLLGSWCYFGSVLLCAVKNGVVVMLLWNLTKSHIFGGFCHMFWFPVSFWVYAIVFLFCG